MKKLIAIVITFIFIFEGGGYCVQDEPKFCLRPQLVFGKQAQKFEIDKRGLAGVFPKHDFLEYLFHNLVGAWRWVNRDETEDLNERLNNIRAKYREWQKLTRKPVRDFSSEQMAQHYLEIVHFLKEIMSEMESIKDSCQSARNRELMNRYIEDTKNIIAGLELLLNGSYKEIGINELIEEIHALVFSEYHRRRAPDYAVDFRLSTDAMTIFSQQDRIAYAFFYLLHPFVKRMDKAALIIETVKEDIEGKPFVSIKFYDPEADVDIGDIEYSDDIERSFTRTLNVGGGILRIEGHTAINYRTIESGYLPASELVRELGGTIDLIREDEKIRGFKVLLPLSESRDAIGEKGAVDMSL